MAVAQAPAGVDGTEREPQAAAARAVAGPRIGTAATRALVVSGALVVAKPEEPNQPHDQEAHVEDPEAHHEEPTPS
jgi:hypothetical protein